MKTKIFILLLSCSVILNACKNDDNSNAQICTEIFVYGLNVTLKDANTNAIITEDVTITATDGTYQETLMTTESIESFFGAGEREGSYIITVNSDNYQTFISDPIVVALTEDDCHVNPQVLEFLLLPN
jgi:hypothetical protein